jgi:hypothetical protein
LPTFTFNNREYDTDNLSDTARSTLMSLSFVEEQIQQRRNELAIADTARLAYRAALKREMQNPAGG